MNTADIVNKSKFPLLQKQIEQFQLFIRTQKQSRKSTGILKTSVQVY